MRLKPAMMPISPTSAFLRDALQAHVKARTYPDIVNRSGVPSDAARRASKGANGRATHVNHHMRLCAVLGLDPVTGETVPETEPRDILPWFFAVGLKIKRRLKGHSMRVASAEMGISVPTIHRLEVGYLRSFDSFLAACRYMDMQPSKYLGFTSNITGNTSLDQTHRIAA